MNKRDFDFYFGNDVILVFFEYEGKEGYVSRNYDEDKKMTMYVLFFDGEEVIEYNEENITKTPFINGKSLEQVAGQLENIEG